MLRLTRLSLSIPSIVLFAACSLATEPAPPAMPTPVSPTVEVHVPLSPIAPNLTVQSTLSRCLLDGGELVLRHAVDNDDVAEHGAVISFAASDERLAVGAADGTLKLWTLDGFLGTLSAGELLYGAELAATPALDLVFLGDEVVGGDARGLVTAWRVPSPDELFFGDFRVLGGTDPDVAIVSVAVDARGEWLAHAEAREGGAVRLRALDGTTVVGPIDTAMEVVSDLAFDGEALFVGGDGLARFDLEGTEVARVAYLTSELDARGGVVASVGDGNVGLFDAALNLRWKVGSDAISIALASDSLVVLTLSAERLEVRASEDGRLLADTEVPNGVLVRSDAGAVLTASEDGWVRAFGCE